MCYRHAETQRISIPMTTSLHLRLAEIALTLDDEADFESALRRRVAHRLQVSEPALPALMVVRRALDVRRQHPQYVYSVEFEAPATDATRWLSRPHVALAPVQRAPRLRLSVPPPGPPPVVVGAGPAGLFAALTLTEAGWPPVVIERGKPVELRSRDVSALYARGVLNPESNVCYGEGGAGTYSDGKLYTRRNDPQLKPFLHTLVALGAPPRIAVNTRPHVGTDRLVRLLKALRARLQAGGAQFLFSTRVVDLHLADGGLRGFTLAGGAHLEARRAILATGHSAHDVWFQLERAGLPLQCRPFAVGFRVEHPQAHINALRYGAYAEHPLLPAADYRLTHTNRAGRGAYSFCMCPGGVIVTTPTEAEHLCLNGMSHAARSGRFANSALVVTVGPEDFAQAGFTGVFAGLEFQRLIEQRAFAWGGNKFEAPATRLTDFANGRVSGNLGPTSYRRGLNPAPLHEVYPEPLTETLGEALTQFERRLPGFVTSEAQLLGVETRTASPVRVPRGEDFQALGARGLYPSGEGMGYGGGIASAALDGIRVARALLREAGAIEEVVSRPGETTTEAR